MIALVLILIFSQKLGLELWLHNLFHEFYALHSYSLPSKDSPTLAKQQIKCNCLEDVFMPLLQTDAYLYQAPTRIFTNQLLSWYYPIISTRKVFSALRGPPTI
jgi:hypothetical protein